MNGCGRFFIVVRSILVIENLRKTFEKMYVNINFYLRTMALRAPLEVRESLRLCFTESERLDKLGETENLRLM